MKFLAVAQPFLLLAASIAAAEQSPTWSSLDDVAFVATKAAEARGVASVEVSADGRWLYAATLGGAVLRWPIDPETGALGEVQSFDPAHFQHPDGPRGLIGLAFDPTDPSVLWVSDNYPIALWGSREMRPEFSGRISRIRIAEGPDFTGVAETYVRGLPRSCGDHVTNSLRFRANPDAGDGGPAFLLYVSQGSNSASGKADKLWCFRPERLMTAAILEIDPTRDPPEGGFDVASEPLPEGDGNRRFGYNWRLGPLLWARADATLKTEGIPIDSGPYEGAFLHFDANGVAAVRSGRARDSAVVANFYDPFAADAPVRIFATGMRNGYDLVWHSNGWLYVAVNGAAGGGAIPDDPSTPLDEGVARAERGEDQLARFRRGDYGGHPNPLRSEYVLHGGNPTQGPDPNEIGLYPVGVAPDPRYRPEQVYMLGHHWSPNGSVEYRAPGNALDAALIVANYSQGNNLRSFVFEADGSVRANLPLVDPGGAEITFVDPLDVTQGPGGRLFVSTLDRSNGRSQIMRLDPARRGEVPPAD